MGETILDILFQDDKPVAAVHGGSSFNSIISVGRARLPCTFLGYTGGDIVGNKMLKFMQKNGVSTEYMMIRPTQKSALSLAFLDKNGDADYMFYKDVPQIEGEWKRPYVEKDDVMIFGSYYAICQGMRPQVEEMLCRMEQGNGIVYYDLNFRRSHLHELDSLFPTIHANFQKSTIVRGSTDDFDIMFGSRDAQEIYRQHISPYCPLFICTSGGGKITVCTPRGTYEFLAPKIKSVVSTVGAGDNFNAGFCCSLLRYGIRREHLSALDRNGWLPLIEDACAFAGNVCQSTDNYVSTSFGQEFATVMHHASQKFRPTTESPTSTKCG